MPTKPNRAGQQQNYVPQGNGDASGEYADHSTGSNIHFTNFKKPEQEQISDLKTEIATPKKTLEETILPNLTDKQKHEFLKTLLPYKKSDREFNADRIIKMMRWYGGSYGDLSKYSDEQLKDAFNFIMEQEDIESEDTVWVKKGKDWYRTNRQQLYNALGIKTYTDEEKANLLEQKHQKNISMTKVQQQVVSEIRNSGYKGTLSFNGLNDENSKQVGKAIMTTFNDFPELKNNILSFGTESGVKAEVEESYRKHEKTEEYKVSLEKYKETLKKLNPGKEFSDEETKRYYKNLYIQNNTHTTTGAFWGVCGAAMDSDKSWIQLKNTRYKKYQEENERSIAKRGYPNNIGASFQATTYHELGHAICNFVLGSTIFDGYRDTQTLDQVKEVRKKYNQPISSYGRRNISEYIAECFASHYTDGTNEQANEVFNLIFKKYKEKYK